MIHRFSGLMKPYGGRRSSATATGMRQYQARKDMCQMCHRINQRFHSIFSNCLQYIHRRILYTRKSKSCPKHMRQTPLHATDNYKQLRKRIDCDDGRG